MDKNTLTRIIQEFGELLNIPDKLELIDKFMQPIDGLTTEERCIVVNALDFSIILSFCKSIENRNGIDKALEKLKDENSNLHNKINYLKNARHQAIAHLGGEEAIKSLNIEKMQMGNTPKEVFESYNEILDWVLGFLEKRLRDYIKAVAKEIPEKPTNKWIDKNLDGMTPRQIFDDIRQGVKDAKTIGGMAE